MYGKSLPSGDLMEAQDHEGTAHEDELLTLGQLGLLLSQHNPLTRSDLHKPAK
jgi:hypothetical protein